MLKYILKDPSTIQSIFTTHKQELPNHKLTLPPNHQFSPKRLADFSTGRYCAMKALEQIGIQNVIIPIGKDREPIWPEGIVGSISHCESLTGAIVSRKADHISLGLDILIGTPNRVNALFSSAGFNINTIRMFVVDDSEILFRNRMDSVILRLSASIEKTQRIFFCSEITERVEVLADKIMIEPLFFEMEEEE